MPLIERSGKNPNGFTSLGREWSWASARENASGLSLSFGPKTREEKIFSLSFLFSIFKTIFKREF
jgi:hypothetical protein